MPRCLECEKNKTIEETKNNATETAELVFKSFALEDKVLIDSYTKPWNLQCSDLSFANLFIWGADGKMEYAEKNNVLYIKLEFKGVPVFLWAPIPKYGVEVDYRKAVYEGIDYMKKRGVEPTYRSVWTVFKDKMLTACPELFSMPTDIAWDYVYTRESLATLKGKKLHGKRNHINKFLSKYPDYEYRRLDKSMIADCITLYDHWMDEKTGEDAQEMVDEFNTFMQEYKNKNAGKEAPKVLILMGLPGSYIVATENSYVGSLVEMAGGQNVYAGTDEEFLSANTEDIKTKEPDVILRASHAMPEQVQQMFADEFEKNDIWKHFAAVQNGRVYDLDSSLFGMSANFSYQQALEALQPMLYNS